MRAISKRIVILAVSVLLLAILAVGSASPAFAAAKYYNDYTYVATVKDKSTCTGMQGMAVGAKYAYSAKVDGKTNTKAFLTKTNLKTGESTLLKTPSGGTYLDYIGHANGIDSTSINDRTNLYIATMKTGNHSLVRVEVNGSTVTKKGNYTLKYNGENLSATGVAVYKKTDTKITLLIKKGCTFYTGTVKPTAKSGTITLTKAFSINIASVKINGKTNNLKEFVGQGFGYEKNYIFVPLWSNVNRSQSVVVVYNIKNATGKITSDPNLSFRLTSKSYDLCEIEDCGISSTDGKLYFNTNRRKSKTDTNYDGIHYFTGYKFK